MKDRTAEVAGTVAALRERLDRARRDGEYEAVLNAMVAKTTVSRAMLEQLATLDITNVEQMNGFLKISGEDLTTRVEAAGLANFEAIEAREALEAQLAQATDSIRATVEASEQAAGVVLPPATEIRAGVGHVVRDYATEERSFLEADARCDFCHSPKPKVIIRVPDFPVMPGHVSTGGWAACRVCADLVYAHDREAVFQRAMHDKISTKPGGKEALRVIHNKFWAAFDANRHLLVKPSPEQRSFESLLYRLRTWVTRDLASRRLREARCGNLADRAGVEVAAVLRTLEVADEVVVARANSDRVAGEIADQWKRITQLKTRADNKPDALAAVADAVQMHAKLQQQFTSYEEGLTKLFTTLETETPDVLQQLHVALDAAQAELPAQAPFAHQTLWMRAIEMQYAALAFNADNVRLSRDGRRDPDENWADDMAALRRAECYAWGKDPTLAVQMAAQSVPHDSCLRLDHVPQIGFGWYWFEHPLPIHTALDAQVLHGLLWGWTTMSDGTQRLMVSGYNLTSVDGKLEPVASTVFFWKVGESIHDLFIRSAIEYDSKYGPGGPLHDTANAIEPIAISRQRTLKAIVEIALFFIMSCVWLKQDIVGWSAGHVERHRRKAFVREHKLERPPSDVKVIALRRVHYEHREATGEGNREYKWQWVVRGHPRNQFYPGEGVHKLIWIDPYPKGPSDMPLKVPKHTVFAVTR
jgi:hypothetical protein